MTRSLILAFLSCSIFFLVGEFGSRIWITHYGDALAKTRSILEIDWQLGWRQRPLLNTKFLGLPLRTNEYGWRAESIKNISLHEKRILVLGPSSTFGWGVREDETYAALLGSKLASMEGSIGVINAGEIGYSSYQGAQLFSSVAAEAVDPDIVVVAYGINDLDRYRFYFQDGRPDIDALGKGERTPVLKLINGLSRSSFVFVLEKIADGLRELFNPASRIHLIGTDPIPSVRVPLPDFETNIRELVNKARSHGASVILLTTVTDLPVSSIYIEAEVRFEDALSLWRAGELERANDMLEQIIARDPHHSDAYYYLSDIARKNGHARSAVELFETARVNEPYRISRDLGSYNEILKRIADDEGVYLLDLSSWMEDRDRKELFVDPIHFSQAGNDIVAEGLLAIIKDNNLLK